MCVTSVKEEGERGRVEGGSKVKHTNELRIDPGLVYTLQDVMVTLSWAA